MSKLISHVALTITSGQAVSTEIVLDGRIPTILQMSTGWTAADITFAGSVNGADFYFIYKDDGTILQLPTDASHRINLPSAYLTDHKSLKVASGTPAAPVNQGADRILYMELWE